MITTGWQHWCCVTACVRMLDSTVFYHHWKVWMCFRAERSLLSLQQNAARKSKTSTITTSVSCQQWTVIWQRSFTHVNLFLFKWATPTYPVFSFLGQFPKVPTITLFLQARAHHVYVEVVHWCSDWNRVVKTAHSFWPVNRDQKDRLTG